MKNFLHYAAKPRFGFPASMCWWICGAAVAQRDWFYAVVFFIIAPVLQVCLEYAVEEVDGHE